MPVAAVFLVTAAPFLVVAAPFLVAAAPFLADLRYSVQILTAIRAQNHRKVVAPGLHSAPSVSRYLHSPPPRYNPDCSPRAVVAYRASALSRSPLGSNLLYLLIYSM